MNSSNAKDYLPLVQALAEGREIQYRPVSVANWIDVDDITDAYPADRYRIKPGPKEIWVNRYTGGDGDSFYYSEEEAKEAADGHRTVIQVRYREVIE